MKACLVWLSAVACLVGVHGPLGVALSAADGAAVYQAIRGGDLPTLRALIVTKEDANAPGDLGLTPLMAAAVAGSADAMKLLLDRGADPNVQNALGTTALMMAASDRAKVRLLVDRGADVNLASQQGRTALFLAAMSDRSAETVRLLLSKGADATVRDVFGNTVLTAAAVGNDADTIQAILDAGVDVNLAGPGGPSPLMVAVYHGASAVVRRLIARGADVNASGRPAMLVGGDPKSGPLALSAATPLMTAAAMGPADVVKALLDAGADVNARDGRQMTPLMFAVARNHQDPAILKLLLEAGADPALQSNAGETAVQWARKLARPAALELLGTEPPERRDPAPGEPAADARAAVERSMALLERSSERFFEVSGCISCHHQDITESRGRRSAGRGLRMDPDGVVKRLKMLEAGPSPLGLAERLDPLVPEIFASRLASMAANHVPPNPVTDLVAANIASAQSADGSWHAVNGISQRPPAEEGAITRVALCIRALSAYGPPGRGAEMRERIARARRWLERAAPVTSEEHNMQLLGLFWAGASSAQLRPLAQRILAAQQPDGGWRQHEGVPVDAYATGQSLFALARAGGMAPTDAAYQRGVKFLLDTQSADGAWRVESRSPKFQAYFDSGFPYGGNQWISAWATGWATMALAQTVPAADGGEIAAGPRRRSMASPSAEPHATEHLPLGFRAFPGSYALLSDSSDTNAAVFLVHGFWGDAADTWQEFQRLVDSPQFATKFARADLFFYDYPSARHTVKVATERFEKFVQLMLTGPWEAVDERTGGETTVTPPDDGRPAYERVVLVGHSLGGVVIRTAIARAAGTLTGAPDVWPLLLGRAPQLFAPAHSGFRHDDLVTQIASLTRIAGILFAYWRFRHAKVYAELKAGSVVLNGLKDDTLLHRTSYQTCPALFADVLWGVEENVVFDKDYPKDRTPDSVAGKDHQSICKPTGGFDAPVVMVSRALE